MANKKTSTKKKTPTVNRDDAGHDTTPKCDHEHQGETKNKLHEHPSALCRSLEGYSRYQIKAEILNIRKEPSLEADIVGTFSGGDIVEVSGKKENWGAVEKGFILLDFAYKV